MRDELDVSRIKEMQKIRRNLIVYFVISIVIPLALGPPILQAFEGKANDQLDEYPEVFLYNYQIMTGAPITDAIPETHGGKIVAGIVSLVYLVLFGLLAAIIMTSVQIRTLRREIR